MFNIHEHSTKCVAACLNTTPNWCKLKSLKLSPLNINAGAVKKKEKKKKMLTSPALCIHLLSGRQRRKRWGKWGSLTGSFRLGRSLQRGSHTGVLWGEHILVAQGCLVASSAFDTVCQSSVWCTADSPPPRDENNVPAWSISSYMRHQDKWWWVICWVERRAMPCCCTSDKHHTWATTDTL